MAHISHPAELRQLLPRVDLSAPQLIVRGKLLEFLGCFCDLGKEETLAEECDAALAVELFPGVCYFGCPGTAGCSDIHENAGTQFVDARFTSCVLD